VIGCESVTCLRLMASRSSSTTSSPSTPLQLKPLVHLTSVADARLCCTHGNENVKPTLKCWSLTPSSSRNSAIQLAIWSNSYNHTNNSTDTQTDRHTSLLHCHWSIN